MQFDVVAIDAEPSFEITGNDKKDGGKSDQRQQIPHGVSPKYDPRVLLIPAVFPPLLIHGLH